MWRKANTPVPPAGHPGQSALAARAGRTLVERTKATQLMRFHGESAVNFVPIASIFRELASANRPIAGSLRSAVGNGKRKRDRHPKLLTHALALISACQARLPPQLLISSIVSGLRSINGSSAREGSRDAGAKENRFCELKLARFHTRSLLPSQLYLDHSHGPVLVPAT